MPEREMRSQEALSTQMGALEAMVSDILCEAGLKNVDIRTRTARELPGYFKATKQVGSHRRLQRRIGLDDGV